MVARRQVHRLRLGSIGPRRSLDLRSRRHEPEEDHRPRQRKGRARLDAGFEGAALHGRRQEALQLHRRRRQDERRLVERPRAHRIGVGLSRQQVGRVLQTGPHAPLASSTSSRSPAARNATSRTTACCTPRTTRSGPPTAATSSSRRSRAPATASPRRAASRRRWRCGRSSLRDQDRDPMNRDIDNEAQGLAAEAAARQNRRGRGGAATAGRSAHRLERPAAPRAAAHGAGHDDRRPHPGAGRALGRADRVDAAAPAAGAAPARGPTRRRGCTSSTSRAASSRACPRRRRRAGGGGGGRGAAGGGGFGGSSMVFARDGRTLYFRSGTRPLRRGAPATRQARGAAQDAAGGGWRAAAVAAALRRRDVRRRRRQARRRAR